MENYWLTLQAVFSKRTFWAILTFSEIYREFIFQPKCLQFGTDIAVTEL